MNKTLLGLALGVISLSPLAFASADSVDGFTSDSDICVVNVDYETWSLYISPYSDCGWNDYNDECVYSYLDLPNNSLPIYVENQLSCNGNSSVELASSMPFPLRVKLIDNGLYLYESYTDSDNYVPKEISSGKIYVSKSPITYSSSSDSSDNSSFIPTIPSSFTSGLTSLLSNFGSTIVNWLPTIILVALGIYAIFALFRVVRNYARSSFRG